MTILHPETLRRRARKGAALLDDKHPGWADRVDLDRFCIVEPENCVLGQLFEDSFSFGVSQLGVDEVVHGFDLKREHGWAPQAGTGIADANWNVLQRTWVRLINARRTVTA